MRSFKTYDWMVAPGLGLKGLPLSLFALTASYNRAGRKMYESRESLAGYLGYSERQIGKALQSLVADGLLVCRKAMNHREFCMNILTVREVLERKDTKDNPVLSSLRDFLKKCRPMEKEEQSSCPKEKKVPVQGEQSSSSGENKSPVVQEQSSPNNEIYNNTDNKKDDVLSTLPFEKIVEILYPIFFFKNNCDPLREIERFVEFYREKGWRLSGGKVMSEIGDLVIPAESWTVKEVKETGYRHSFMRGWKEVYRIAPENLKKEILRIRPNPQNDSLASIRCSEEMGRWLTDVKQTIDVIFRGHSANNYRFEWEVKSAEAEPAT